jgi:pentatricopeptide repeat protein
MTYNTFLDLLCKISKVKKTLDFVDVIDLLISRGSLPNVTIHGLCKKGNEKALDFPGT